MGHDVERQVRQVDDFRVALPDPGRFENHEVEPGGPAYVHRLLQRPARGAVGLPGGEGAHVDALGVGAVDRIHADPVAQERSAGAPPRGVDREDGNLQVLEIVEEAPDDLVGQRRLPRAPGAGNAKGRNRRGPVVDGPVLRSRSVAHLSVTARPAVAADADFLELRGVCLPARRHRNLDRHRLAHFRLRQIPRHDAGVSGRRRIRNSKLEIRNGEVTLLHHRVDHPLQAHLHPLLRREDAGDAVRLEFFLLFGHDDAPAAAVQVDVTGAPLFEQVVHVREELDVAALVAGNGNALGVLLNGGVDDLLNGTVVAEVDDLDARPLQDAPHDVDRGVVAVEEARRRHEANRMLGLIAVGIHGRRNWAAGGRRVEVTAVD